MESAKMYHSQVEAELVYFYQNFVNHLNRFSHDNDSDSALDLSMNTNNSNTNTNQAAIVDPTKLTTICFPSGPNAPLVPRYTDAHRSSRSFTPFLINPYTTSKMLSGELEAVKNGPLSEQLRKEELTPAERERKNAEKISALWVIQTKLQQLIEAKAKLKNLRRDKKEILRQQRRLERIERRQKQQDQQRKRVLKTSTPRSMSIITTTTPANSDTTSSQNTTVASPSSALVPQTTPLRPAPALWRPIEFSSATRPISKPMPKLKPKPISLMQASPSRPRPPVIAKMPCDEYDMITIGPNGTKVHKRALETMNWSLKETYITRKLLMEVFDRETLAFHNLTGKPSPAFVGCNKPLKGKLDPLKVADVIHIVTKHLNITEKEVRQTITIKCADENKRVRNGLSKILRTRKMLAQHLGGPHQQQVN